MSERQPPGRYKRTSNGLVASLVVTVLAIIGFLIFRGVFSDDYQDQPPDLDYFSTVRTLQDAGVEVVYPSSLPDGWIARDVNVVPGERPSFDLALLTDDDKFVGVHQEDASVDDLLTTYVDENPEEGDVLEVDGSVASSWQEWSDSGGDHAFTAEVGDDSVIVFGSAPVADLEGIVRSLSDETLPGGVSETTDATVTPIDPSGG